MPRIAWFWVALAGPAVSVVIAGGLFAWLHFSAALAPLEQLTRCATVFDRLRVGFVGAELNR